MHKTNNLFFTCFVLCVLWYNMTEKINYFWIVSYSYRYRCPYFPLIKGTGSLRKLQIAMQKVLKHFSFWSLGFFCVFFVSLIRCCFLDFSIFCIRYPYMVLFRLIIWFNFLWHHWDIRIYGSATKIPFTGTNIFGAFLCRWTVSQVTDAARKINFSMTTPFRYWDVAKVISDSF